MKPKFDSSRSRFPLVIFRAINVQTLRVWAVLFSSYVLYTNNLPSFKSRFSFCVLYTFKLPCFKSRFSFSKKQGLLEWIKFFNRPDARGITHLQKPHREQAPDSGGIEHSFNRIFHFGMFSLFDSSRRRVLFVVSCAINVQILRVWAVFLNFPVEKLLLEFIRFSGYHVFVGTN